MATSNSYPRRSIAYRLLAVIAVLLVAGAVGTTLAAQPAAGQADVTLDTLQIPDANETVNGDVSDVRVSIAADYSYDVPDVERYVISLMVGPSAEDLTTVDFVQTETTEGQASGSVALDGSLLSHDALSAADFDPSVAGNTTTEVVVALDIEVRRSTGEAVTSRVTEPVTVTVIDGTELSASVGGSGSVEVQTA